MTKIPNYKRIYMDLIDRKYPEKQAICDSILAQEKLSFMDVIRLNEIMFEKNKKEKLLRDHKYRSYDEKTIIKILKYQKENQLNNSQVANHFKMSRNTIANWKKIF
ncbi:helix-turn-helix domain-containing protein [Myroides indicus]|uniref:Transposase n=1 Tax=Myroides indicus TaxID=1323422 RepID=A0A4R7EX14_9FLAO|nr:helix-turn-helix domain-containing protein [Myroides indicus]TDS56855.1 hypothetical protein C8P70_1183 [Myroides indicus]